jgi:hypothetical protein
MNLEFYPSSGTATDDVLWTPLADLVGVTTSNLSTGTDASKAGNAVWGLLKQIYNVVSPSSFAPLGISVGYSESKPAIGLTTRTFSLTAQYFSDIAAQSVGMLPVPSTGTNSGIGKFAIVDVFPNAAKVSAGGAVSAAGIGIKTAALVNYGSPAHSNLNPASGQDNRNWFAALYNYFVDGGLDLRVTGTTQSAFTSLTQQSSGLTLPSAATATTNPTTGILAAQLIRSFSNQRTFTVSIETQDDLTADTISVRVA